MSYVYNLSFSPIYVNNNKAYGQREVSLKPGVIEIGKVKIKIYAGDTLESIVRKINYKRHITGVTAKLERKDGSYRIVLSSKKTQQYQDTKMLDGLVLTFLSEYKPSPNRLSTRFLPYQHDDNSVGFFSVRSVFSDDSSVFDEEQIINNQSLPEENNITPLLEPVIQETIEIPLKTVQPTIIKRSHTPTWKKSDNIIKFNAVVNYVFAHTSADERRGFGLTVDKRNIDYKSEADLNTPGKQLSHSDKITKKLYEVYDVIKSP